MGVSVMFSSMVLVGSCVEEGGEYCFGGEGVGVGSLGGEEGGVGCFCGVVGGVFSVCFAGEVCRSVSFIVSYLECADSRDGDFAGVLVCFL